MTVKKNILLTTSREPTDRMRTFCNNLGHSIPNVIRVNRGKLSLDRVAEKALELDASRVMIVDRWKHGFAVIRFFRIGISGLTPHPPILNIADVRLRRGFETEAKRIKSVALRVTSGNSATRNLASSLTGFFDIPMFAGQNEVENFSAVMQVSDEAFGRFKITFVLLPSLVEVGPRMDVSKVVWDEIE